MGGDRMEVEIKLLVAREDLGRVLSAQAVQRRASGRVHAADLVSIYCDTPQLDLHGEGLALRLRQSGERWLQTLKSGAASAAGLTQREEYEWPVAGRRIDLGLLETTPYAPVFAKRRVRETLRPVFTTRFSRRLRRLALADGTLAELCVDEGEIRAGRSRRQINEVEIELKAGNRQALFEFAAELLVEVPFRLGTDSKAERGYALYRNEQPRPRKASSFSLRPDMPRAMVLQTVAHACLAQIHANEHGFLTGRDPEFLHQLRVGFRRLRVALAMPEEPDWRAALEPVREEMRWLFSVLGPARNWDVFVTEILPPIQSHFGSDEGLAALRTRCLRLRRRHLALARKAVRSTRYPALLLSLATLLYGRPPPELPDTAEPARAFAQAIIERRDRALRKRGEGVRNATPEERHRARIAAKKLRYCAEFFSALYPQKKVKRFVDALSEVQEMLGTINDASVANLLLGELGSGARADARMIGMVKGWVAAGEARAIERLVRSWDGFEGSRQFW